MEEFRANIDSLWNQLGKKDREIQDEKEQISRICKSIQKNKAEEEKLRLEIGCYENVFFHLETSEASQKSSEILVVSVDTDAACDDDEQDSWANDVDELVKAIEAKQAVCPLQSPVSPKVAQHLQAGEEANQYDQEKLVETGEKKIDKREHTWDDDWDDDGVDSERANQQKIKPELGLDSGKKPEEEVERDAACDEDEQDSWAANVEELVKAIEKKQAPNPAEQDAKRKQDEKEKQPVGKEQKIRSTHPVVQKQERYEGWISSFRGAYGHINCQGTYKMYKCDVFFLAKDCNEKPRNTPKDRNKQTWWQWASFDLTINDLGMPQAVRLTVHPPS
jgi:hypothetical protein